MSLEFDDDTARKLEALYLSQDAINRRQAVLDALQLQPAEQVLDIGTGLGFVTLDMADMVGPSGSITGIDSSEPMLEFARKRCADKPWINFQTGDATNLPIADSSFDVAVSVQVYEYIAELTQALSEMHRVLRPGGRGVIVASDWKSTIWHSANPERMSRILVAWEEHCAYSDLPRVLGTRLEKTGFDVRAQKVIVQFNPVCDTDAYSYHIIDLIKSFAPGRAGVTGNDVEQWADELRQLENQGEYFFCLNQFLFLVTKSNEP